MRPSESERRPVESLASHVIAAGNRISSALEPIGVKQSIGAFLASNTRRFGEHPIYKERRAGKYCSVSWDEFLLEVVSLSLFLRDQGVETGDRVAVISRNRGEMLATEFSVMSIGAVYAPIFAGYPAEQLNSLLLHCDAKVILVSGSAELEKIEAPTGARVIVSYDELSRADAGEALGDFTGELLSYSEAIAEHSPGDRNDPSVDRFLEDVSHVDPDEPCLMMYTSGTMKEQKGVLLSHDAILSQQRALARIWSINQSDRLLTYLPWHHSFGGIFEKYAGLYNGATLALDQSYGKNFPVLLENWKEIKPTIYFSVPLIHQQLVSHARTNPEQEPEIFHDELRFVFTAAAPLPANISEYFKQKKIPVVEGWGLTETAPCCTITDMHENRSIPGMVGYPIPGVQIGLADDGEILIQGPNVMRGYFRNPEAMKQAFPGDGWFHTGDLGEFAGGGLKLLARKDRVFKLLNAEKVVPTLLENALAGSNRYVRHVLVVGSGEDSLAALIFPNFFLIEEEFGEDREAADRVVKESYRESILELNHSNSVKFEHIRAFAVVSRELSLENDELTPSMKVRVHNVMRNSEEYVDAIYNPLQDCECRFLQKVFRIAPDSRRCPLGKDLTLDQCHECGTFVFGES